MIFAFPDSVTITPDGGPCTVGGITYTTVVKTLTVGEHGPVIRYHSPSGESEVAAEGLALQCFLADLVELVGPQQAQAYTAPLLGGYAASGAA